MTYIKEVIDRAYVTWIQNLGCGCDSRSRNEDGTYKGDDPCTKNIDEAWSSGKKPVRKKKATKKKS